jgi:hypothetical protein
VAPPIPTVDAVESDAYIETIKADARPHARSAATDANRPYAAYSLSKANSTIK